MVFLIGTIFISQIIALAPFHLWVKLTKEAASFQEILKDIETNGDYVWIALILTLLISGPVLLLAVRLRRDYPASSYLALKKATTWQYITWIFLMVVFAESSNLLLYLLGIDITPQWMIEVYQSATCMPCFLLAIIVAAPLFEEFIFRGFVFTGINQRLGPLWAVVFATVPWTLIHFQYFQYGWYYLAITLGLGLLMSLARAKTGSIYVPLAMHMIANTIASIEVEWIS